MTGSLSSDARSALSELSALLLSTETTEELLQGVAMLSVRALATATTCGITLEHDGRPRTVATADALAAELDEWQYELDEGPCLQAMRTGEVVSVPDLAEEGRWDGYPAIAMSQGVRSMLSTPLVVDTKPVGVLNLYSRAVAAFDGNDSQLVQLLADLAAATVTASLRRHDELALTANLRSALSSRAVIDQALGIVMAQQHCTPDEAFAALRTVSQRRNVKLRTVATEMVTAVQQEPRAS